MHPLIIAELGTGFGTDFEKAKALIDAAAEAGADCIKIQIVIADEILHPLSGIVPLPGGDIPLYDVFKQLEADITFYKKIKTYTEEKGKLFLATPFGLKSAAMLKSLQPAAVKIASPELNYTQLLQLVAEWNIPVLLSSGVSKLSDIKNALAYFHGRDDVCVLHCITAYPAPEGEYNLRVLQQLQNTFGVSVGVSDHSLDPVVVPVLSLAMGACVIEKHFCLSHDDDGLDDKIALMPDAFAYMCKSVRHANDILGDGEKRLSKSEAQNYGRTNRSLHAVCDIHIGDIFTKDNVAILRTEKVLQAGMQPHCYDDVLGKTARKEIPVGQGIRVEDI
jgi:sialic acid synthase SpsE